MNGVYGEGALRRRRPQKINSGGSDTSLSASDGGNDEGEQPRLQRASSRSMFGGRKKGGSPRSPDAHDRLHSRPSFGGRRRSVDVKKYKDDDKPTPFRKVSHYELQYALDSQRAGHRAGHLDSHPVLPAAAHYVVPLTSLLRLFTRLYLWNAARMGDGVPIQLLHARQTSGG